ncbi:MAG TPA: type III secretion system export apparatus subunit SctR [Burkholderiales bacterium]|nr:type III secretion system export apparatus subunit SctR [Burkholderiales bacterium]
MTSDPIAIIILLAIMSLMPIVFILTTSFIKIAMVCILTRESLGVQQIPPNIVIYSLSLILSFYVMGPVYNASFLAIQDDLKSGKPLTYNVIIDDFQKSSEPIKQFLIKHSDRNERIFFYQSLNKFWSKDMMSGVTQDNFIVLIPAFMVSELTKAFKIGFLIYLPSVIIDIIVSNILMAMGMMMMSPVTISLPIKLLLFIAIDGWSRLLHVLISSY